jgi:hypothetical protein
MMNWGASTSGRRSREMKIFGSMITPGRLLGRSWSGRPGAGRSGPGRSGPGRSGTPGRSQPGRVSPAAGSTAATQATAAHRVRRNKLALACMTIHPQDARKPARRLRASPP